MLELIKEVDGKLTEQLEKTLETLREEAESLEEAGEDILQNNSYCNDSTGYNTVEDYEFTPHYNGLQRQIRKLEKQLTTITD
jgi:uncharacterized protein (UPF0297 family)